MLHETIRNDDFERNTSVAMLEQRCNHSIQCRNNVATLCCAENRHCKSFRTCNITLREPVSGVRKIFPCDPESGKIVLVE